MDQRVGSVICEFLDCRLAREQLALAPCLKHPIMCSRGNNTVATVPIHDCARRHDDCGSTLERLRDARVAAIVSDEDRFAPWWLSTGGGDHRQCISNLTSCDSDSDGALGEFVSS